MFGRFTANGYLPIEAITYKLTLAKIANLLPVGGFVEYGTAKSKYLCLESSWRTHIFFLREHIQSFAKF